MASAPPPIPPDSASGPRRFAYWRESRLGRLAVTGWTTSVRWCREDGYWYLSSTAAHAVGLVCLAMISLALPEVVATSFEKAPAFDEVEVAAAPAEPMVDRFEVGETPLEPSELTTELLSQYKALPIAAQTEKFYDDSPEFKEAGGGTSLDLDAPKLGGLGGLNLKNLPGPAGLGGVGVGLGTGVHAGFGGSGEGYGGRGQGHRKALLGSLGGTKPGERAVAAALNWFHRHQTSQGRWSLDFRRQCRGTICSGPGGARSDAAATGLALLPFLGAGQTHKSKGPYQKCIAKGIGWLIKQQKPDGDLSGGAPLPMYSHGIAAIALCEAYGMTHDEYVGRAARRAVAYIQMAQNRSTGGWRYLPGERGDTSVFGWQMMALKSAQLAGLPVDSLTMENSKKWLNSVAKGEHLGLYSYQPYQQVTPTMTAVGMLCRQFLGIDPKAPSMLEGKQCLLENLPDGKMLRNSYYWYYATLAMHNFADTDWDVWNRQMRRVLIESQEREGCATGSWDPDHPTADVWGEQGGRVMVTSLNTLSLEIYYRYLPLFQTDSLVPGRAGKMGFTKPVEK